MLKFKLLLLLLILPISYLIYHLIGFDSGINAYYEKVKLINSKEIYNRELKLEITDYKNKLKLLNPNTIDLDYLEEKSFGTLGNSSKGSYNIILK